MNEIKPTRKFNDLDVFQITGKILLAGISKRFFLSNLDFPSSLPAEVNKYVNYSVDSSVNRSIILGYILYSPCVPTPRQKALLTLLVGLIAAIDDVIDTTSLPEGDFIGSLGSSCLVDKQGNVLELGAVQDYINVVADWAEIQELEDIANFLIQASFAEEKRQCEKGEGMLTPTMVRNYREATTYAYTVLLARLLNIDSLTASSINSVAMLFQLADDCADMDQDRKFADVNYLLAIREAALQEGRQIAGHMRHVLNEDLHRLSAEISTPIAKRLVWLLGKLVVWQAVRNVTAMEG